MVMARVALLEILKNQPDRKMNYVALSRELDRRNILGFGVEARDVIYALAMQGVRINYDRENDLVSLDK
jgi:hypothetical protein